MEADDLELKGDLVESFERIDRIAEVILLGERGGIRRIIIKKADEEIKEAKDETS